MTEGIAERALPEGGDLLPGRVVARLARWMEVAVGEVDLSLAQYRLLALLADGSSEAKVLARGLEVSPPSVTTLVNGLVQRGLVERRRSETDRRRVGHELTRAGRSTLTRADAAIEARLLDLASHLSTRDAAGALDALSVWGEALDAKRAQIVHERELS